MKRWIVLATLILAGCVAPAVAQNSQCPANMVCITQATADKLFNAVQDLLTKTTQLTTAQDTINKLLIERGTSDVEIAKANKIIEEWKEVDVINGMISLKKDSIIALYEKVLGIYQTALDNAFNIIDIQEKQLHGKKSPLAKIGDALKRVADIAIGIGLGRVFQR